MNRVKLIVAGAVIFSAAYTEAKEATVFIDESYETKSLGILMPEAPLRRVMQVSVEDGAGKVGSGQVARYHDSSASEGGALEYSVGAKAPGRMYIEFDILNNNPEHQGEKDALIFSVAQWDTSKNLSLNANAKRAFGVEFSQKSNYRSVVMRVGGSRVNYGSYDVAVPQNVKIWVNDHDTESLSYKRPDTGEMAALEPDSFVLWINDAIAGFQLPSGIAMQKSVSEGHAVLGRVGFGSPSHGIVDFLIDNLHVEDPTGESGSVEVQASNSGSDEEITPERMVGADTIAYRRGEEAMNLFVYRPEGWKAGDKRSALIYFFGGGWTKGTPMKSAGWARWAADLGMVGIAPDYRTKNRFGTSPLESVADSRAAFNWVVEHADQLGIDSERIMVCGSSAGGHVALWTAIMETPPGSSRAEAPKVKPAALYLSSAVTDTSAETGYTPQRFGEHAEALSPVHQLDAAMPPVLMFHACDDELVHYGTAVALCTKLRDAGSECELISVPRGGHGFSSAYPEWKARVRGYVEEFLENQNLLPAVSQL